MRFCAICTLSRNQPDVSRTTLPAGIRSRVEGHYRLQECRGSRLPRTEVREGLVDRRRTSSNSQAANRSHPVRAALTQDAPDRAARGEDVVEQRAVEQGRGIIATV